MRMMKLMEVVVHGSVIHGKGVIATMNMRRYIAYFIKFYFIKSSYFFVEWLCISIDLFRSFNQAGNPFDQLYTKIVN